MGCRVCRARKVKCDGRPNGCRNCERLQLDCVGDSGVPGGHRSSPVALRKIRTYRSCANCRLSKTKCNGDRPKCSRCAAKNLECAYDGGTTPRWARNLNDVTTGDAGSGSHPNDASDDLGAETELGDDGGLNQEADGQSDAPMRPLSSGRPSSAEGDVSMAMAIDEPGADALSWLLSPNLPSTRHLRRLVEQYFANVHPLRCFAFVHKPSFMRQLDKGFASDDETALLHIICAHGAKFYLLNPSQVDQPPNPALLRGAGNAWARKAEYLMLGNFGKVSVQKLMSVVLLHDFHFRMGEFSQALMISGLGVRMAHALRINTEYSADLMCTEPDATAPSVASKESRRRLMWACYVLDAWTGGGIDQLTLLRENDIKIQLPCNERNFGLRIASVTETLGIGHVLQFLPPAIVPRRPAQNMGIMAYYIRVVTLWKRVARYVNYLDAKVPPWLPESDFAILVADLTLWRRELPDFCEYSDETIYARLDSNQLGALVLIHCTYHHNYLELYKICMPDLFKLRQPLTFPPDQREFVQSVQADSYYHALQISNILGEVAEHGARLFADSLLPLFVYESSRVMLYYVARLLDPNRFDAPAKVREALKAVESNHNVMRIMALVFPVAETLSVTVERWLSKLRQALRRAEEDDNSQATDRSDFMYTEMPSPVGSNVPRMVETSNYVLPSLSLHRLAGGASGGGRNRPPDGGPAGIGGDTSWSAENPNAAPDALWDHTSAAHQLVGLSQDASLGQDASLRPSLQHERPVQRNPRLHTFGSGSASGSAAGVPMRDALDLDDLQNFLSWDMYGIMEIGDTVSFQGTEVSGHS